MDLLPALFAAAVFVAHPIQAQSVTYIVQRMSSLATLFCLLALALYLGGRVRTGVKRSSLWLGSAACWVLAVGSKQIAITLPLLIFLYEWYFLQDLSFSWLKRRLLLLAAAVLGMAGFAVLFLSLADQPFDYTNRDFTLLERLLTQPRVLVGYLSLLIYPLPSRLSLIHDVPASHSLLDPPTTAFSILMLLGLFVFSIRFARSQRLLSFCILWIFINLAIESSAVSLMMMFEHRLYLPMLGFSILLANIFRIAFAKQKIWVGAIAVALVISLGVGTYIRNRAWQSHVALWSDVVAKNPQNARARGQLGKAFLDIRRLDAAIPHLERALELDENSFFVHWNIAHASLELGDRGKAIRHLRAALALGLDDPRDSEALRAVAHELIVELLVAEGMWGDAREYAERNLRFTSDLPMSILRLVWIILADPDRNDADIQHAIELAERADLLTGHASPRVLDTLATAYAAAERFNDASVVVTDMLKIDTAAGGAAARPLRERLNRYQQASQSRLEGTF
jgi:tetratricopeptide (TPR) repeat protein